VMLDEHDAIIKALEEGNSDAVRATVAEHIRISRADALEQLEKRGG
jgi:DNA-binding GntR family transcriptional regulator